MLQAFKSLSVSASQKAEACITIGSLSNHDDLGDDDGRYARRDWTEDFVLGGKMKLKQRSCSRTTTFDIFVRPRICQEMASFRDVQNLCLLSHGFNFIDDFNFIDGTFDSM